MASVGGGDVIEGMGTLLGRKTNYEECWLGCDGLQKGGLVLDAVMIRHRTGGIEHLDCMKTLPAVDRS